MALYASKCSLSYKVCIHVKSSSLWLLILLVRVQLELFPGDQESGSLLVITHTSYAVTSLCSAYLISYHPSNSTLCKKSWILQLTTKLLFNLSWVSPLKKNFAPVWIFSDSERQAEHQSRSCILIWSHTECLTLSFINRVPLSKSYPLFESQSFCVQKEGEIYWQGFHEVKQNFGFESIL